MMRPVLVAVVLAGLTGPAVAQGALEQRRPVVDLSLCQPLTRHSPAPDVAYRPGVDVTGRAVAPADLPGSAGSAAPIDRFEVPVTLDLARRMGLRLPSGGLRGDASVGWLTMEGDRLFFNGQPVGEASEAQIQAYCRAR